MEEKDFLQGYELRNWEFSPRIYKIIVAATVLNILGLFVFAQTNMISRSACKSPFVNRVCTVLDTVYVGSKLLSGEKDYVVKDYNKTEIQDADVFWVDTTNVQPQLQYPTGYFQIANRDEIEAQKLAEELAQNGINTTTTTPYTPNPTNPTSPTPKKTPTYIPPPTSGSRSSSSGNDSLARRKPTFPKTRKGGVVKGKVNDSIVDFEDDDDTDVAENKKNPPIESDPVTEVEINKKPLQDFADDVVVKWEKKEIDLNQQFKVKFVGRIKDDGRIDAKKSRFDETADQGDEQMIFLAKDAIQAVGDSGWLTYLRNLGAKEITITLVQNETDIIARVESKMKDEAEAKTMASGMNTLISTTRKYVKLGEDETKLLKAAQTPTYSKNIFILDLKMPKPEAQEMINRKLSEAQAKKNKEEGNTSTRQNGKTKQNDTAEKSVK